MTPEEVGRALGEGWTYEKTGGYETWLPPGDDPGVCVERWSGGWAVSLCGDDGSEAALRPPSPEHAVAVAHLLVLAEQTAAGGPIPRLCSDDCATEREMAYAQGRDEERARVVAYLACQSGTARANTIARGEHWSGHECRDGEPCAASTPTARREAGE